MTEPGKILKSQYSIIKKIGQGGFGRTYLAENMQNITAPACVVKQLHPARQDENVLNIARRLFKKEAETLARLGIHPQIPRLIDYFEEDGEFYLVEELIEGEPLNEKLSRESPWSEAKVLTFLESFLGILDFMHNNGVIHRDIKPENIICVQGEEKFVLVDFGTVKELMVQENRLTVAVGTLGYVPQEQLEGKPEFASDIYALGVVCIQALTGINPINLTKNEYQHLIWEESATASPELKQIIKL
jgi:serine/threonine-protein kinase